MNLDICVLMPDIKGEVSLLYKDLFLYTGKNRKLTNLLYALSKQEEIKKLFSQDEFNSLEEIKSDVFIDKLNVKSIIDSKSLLENKRQELGAVDSSNKTIYYSNVFDVLQSVTDFNDENDSIKAIIKYNKLGFYIDVDTINDENYNFNNIIKSRKLLYDSTIDFLNSLGLNTEFSDPVSTLFNPLNIYNSLGTLERLGKSMEKISIAQASLLVELFRENPLCRRLKAELGNNLPQALAILSGNKYIEDLDVSEYQEEQLNNLFSTMLKEMSKISKEDITELKNGVKDSIEYEETIGGTNGLSVKQTLNELYKIYGLDQESFSNLTSRVTSFSEAAKRLLNILVLRLAQLDKEERKSTQKIIENALKKIDNQEYIVSILEMFKDVFELIEYSQAELEAFSQELKENPSSLSAIKALARIITHLLDLYKVYSPVMKQLANAQLLENDSMEDDVQIQEIKEMANQAVEFLTTIEEHARSKQIDVVQALLGLYWKKGTKLPDGTEIELTGENGLMELARKDINLFDRFIYSINTCNDELVALLGQVVKEQHEKRDDILRDELRVVRSATKLLHDSGSNSKFMFELDKDGFPKRVISDYDWDRFNSEFEQYKKQIREDESIPESKYEKLENKWIRKHLETANFEYTDAYGNKGTIELVVPTFKASRSVKDRLTPLQYKYYQTMMGLKAAKLNRMSGVPNESLFDVIEISNDATRALADTGGNPVKAYNVLKNKIKDMFVRREDDTQYGSVYSANNITLKQLNERGEIIDKLPLFYTHKIEDRSRVSTDFSHAMLAYLASSEQYILMDDVVDALLLAKDYLLNTNRYPEKSGDSTIMGKTQIGKRIYTTVASKTGSQTQLQGLLDDFFERSVYGKNVKEGGNFLGTKIKNNKLTDFIVGYNSFTGLSVNFLGAEANLLVGKIQMLIEAGLGLGGEFFNMKDLMYADAKYFQLLSLGFLTEINSQTKSSLLHLLMEKFDVLDDFYEKAKETGFFDNSISRIIGNANMFFLYGMGEHLLHALGMLAVLHNKRNNVLDANGKEVPLIDAFTVVKDEAGNGRLVIKEGFKTKTGELITKEHIQKIKKRISYVNKSLHGAFGTDDKGMIHRYAFGRMLMNFRLWMPAHYARRFRGTYYDTDLGEYREGFYVTAWNFLLGCAKDLKKGLPTMLAHWHKLSEMQKYNLRRAGAEFMLLGIVSGMLFLLGSEGDKKGNWAARHLIYELKRVQLEIKASNPANFGFIDNLQKLLKSPMATVNTLEKWIDFVHVTDMGVTIEEGKYKGQNKWLHNLEKNAPLYGQLKKAFNMGDEDDLFKLFN